MKGRVTTGSDAWRLPSLNPLLSCTCLFADAVRGFRSHNSNRSLFADKVAIQMNDTHLPWRCRNSYERPGVFRERFLRRGKGASLGESVVKTYGAKAEVLAACDVFGIG